MTDLMNVPIVVLTKPPRVVLLRLSMSELYNPTKEGIVAHYVEERLKLENLILNGINMPNALVQHEKSLYLQVLSVTNMADQLRVEFSVSFQKLTHEEIFDMYMRERAGMPTFPTIDELEWKKLIDKHLGTVRR